MTTQFVIPCYHLEKELNFYELLNFEIIRSWKSESGRKRYLLSNGDAKFCLEEWVRGRRPAPYFEIILSSSRTMCDHLSCMLNVNLKATFIDIKEDFYCQENLFKYKKLDFKVIDIRSDKNWVDTMINNTIEDTSS